MLIKLVEPSIDAVDLFTSTDTSVVSGAAGSKVTGAVKIVEPAMGLSKIQDG